MVHEKRVRPRKVSFLLCNVNERSFMADEQVASSALADRRPTLRRYNPWHGYQGPPERIDESARHLEGSRLAPPSGSNEKGIHGAWAGPLRWGFAEPRLADRARARDAVGRNVVYDRQSTRAGR